MASNGLSGDYSGNICFSFSFTAGEGTDFCCFYFVARLPWAYLFPRGVDSIRFCNGHFSVQKKRYIIINGLILILFFSFFYPQLKETRQVSLMVDSVPKKDDVGPY